MTNSYLEMLAAQNAVIPTGRQPMLAKFNKYSGAFITCIGVIPLEYLNTENFAFVEVDIDPITQIIEGKLESFKIVDKATAKTKIYERQVNNMCKEKIYKRFQLEVQLDILRDAITEIAEKVGVENEALADMNAYIDGVKRANKVLKAGYIANPDFEFITVEAEQAEEEAKMEGGLHEKMGPANLVNLGLSFDR